MSLVEIKDFNTLIDNKPFFNVTLEDQTEAHGKLVEMSRNDDYTQKIYQIFYITKNINSLIQIYQDKQREVFLNKLILQENQNKAMVQQ